VGISFFTADHSNQMDFFKHFVDFNVRKSLGIKILYLPCIMDRPSAEFSSQDSSAFNSCTMTQEEMEELEIPSSVSCENCVICISNLDANTEKLRLLPCEHVFHESCLFSWLKWHAICPLCRHVLKENTNIGKIFLFCPENKINFFFRPCPVTQSQVDDWRTFLQSPESLSFSNILPGTDFYTGPSFNTRSQVQRRLR
jgi:hypothetical protein